MAEKDAGSSGKENNSGQSSELRSMIVKLSFVLGLGVTIVAGIIIEQFIERGIELPDLPDEFIVATGPTPALVMRAGMTGNGSITDAQWNELFSGMPECAVGAKLYSVNGTLPVLSGSELNQTSQLLPSEIVTGYGCAQSDALSLAILSDGRYVPLDSVDAQSR